MNPLFQIPADFAVLSQDELRAFISSTREKCSAIAASAKAGDISEYLTDGRTVAQVKAEIEAALDAVAVATAALDQATAPTADDLAGIALAAETEPVVEAPEPTVAPEEPEATPATPEAPVVAAAVPAPAPATPPAQSPRHRAPTDPSHSVALVAAGGDDAGRSISLIDFGDAAIRRRDSFGVIAPGTQGEKVVLARADYSAQYPDERRLDRDPGRSFALIASAVDEDAIKAALRNRREKEDPGGAMVAAGGLCAPVTPYYGLAQIAQAARPVRDALVPFNADRGGIRFAAPASLGSISTGVGLITAANDHAGGTFATKTCQRIDCPAFSEVDVATIFHCITFGNLGARVFPELVAQWEELVLAQQARVAETALLDGVAAASKKVTAANLGLGATATLPSEILTAAASFRSFFRMDPEAVLRVMMPAWVGDLLVSDMYRTQFQRFDMDKAAFVRILRDNNVEPTFYLDGPTGGGQVFSAQTNNAKLAAFPTSAIWYMFPEGSFLWLDTGVLELGLVRDSVLNATNDFQLFGETFENVAFTGVESWQVTSTLCDSGTVSLPHAVPCPIDYAHTS